jgi:hypothetical protein
MVTVVKLERWALAALLVIGAGFFGFAGAGALRQLWADYKDSADGVYIGIAAICGVIAVGLVVAAVGIVRGWYWRR